jgi:aryl-alcohol dehydrogenase-like predicted oxidoreductase
LKEYTLKSNNLNYKKLSDLDIKISVLGLGTEQFSRSWGKKISIREIQKIFYQATAQGINHIDTAECYGDHISEKLIGDYINNKNEWIIATKFGHAYTKKHKNDSYDLNSVKLQLENSLRALKRDYIDIYYFHSGNNEQFFNDDLWGFLNREIEKGKIRYLGLSLRHDLVLKKNYEQIKNLKKYGINFVQTVFNYLSQESSEYVFDECAKNNIYIIGRMPLAKGLLTGKYKSNDDFDIDDPRLKFKLFNNKAYKIIFNDLRSIPRNQLPKWSISWVLSNPNIISTVVGCKNLKQLNSNLDSLNFFYTKK